jgi:hypothetical protein
MKKITTLLFAIFVLTQSATSQDIAYPLGKFFTVGVGLPMSFSKDEATSPLWYTGKGTEFKIGFLNNTASKCARFDIVMSSVSEKPIQSPKPKFNYSGADLSGIKLTHSYYQKIGGNSHQDVLVGGQFCINLLMRPIQSTGNNRLGFMLFTGLRAAAMTRAHHSEKWSYNATAAVPIVGMFGRPTYIGIPDIEYKANPGPKSFFKNVQFATLNKYSAIDIDFELNKQGKRSYLYNRYYGNFNFHYTPVPKGKPLKMGQYSMGYDFMVKR